MKDTTLPILEFLGATVMVPASESFVARDHFIIGTSRKAKVKISHLGGNFRACFLDWVGGAFAGSTLRSARLRKPSVDGPIIAELGGEAKAETTLTEMFSLMAKQANGEKGELLNNGDVNIFYIRDVNRVLRAVGVDWHDGGWDVYVRSNEYPGKWLYGYRVFSRVPAVV